MPTYKTPDVYIEEISTFPPSVAEVATAIPAFIGHSEKATRSKPDDLRLKPTLIFSFVEYEMMFGKPKDEEIGISIAASDTGGFNVVSVTEPDTPYLMYYAVKMYFDNGGGQCYIISVDSYANPVALAALQSGLNAMAQEDEPTLIVIPEAVKLTTGEYTALVQAELLQCGKLMDRFAIMDLRNGGGSSVLTPAEQTTERGFFGTENLKYGAVYYPFMKTTFNHYVNDAETNVKVVIDGAAAVDLTTLKSTRTKEYNFVKTALKECFVVVPPSGAVAGVYARTDLTRGVWKAPANVGLSDVVEPVVKLTSVQQENFNVDPTTGKSINAIRVFAGKGSLVWGARTLMGNDNEWRYVPVRRFFNMVEESVKKSTYWAVFEPNDANTWVKIRGMIENYLTDKWRDGALAGATTKDAYFVRCGLGTTMTAQDILNGRLNVEIGMAVVRPAEFIILKFSHKLQTS